MSEEYLESIQLFLTDEKFNNDYDKINWYSTLKEKSDNFSKKSGLKFIKNILTSTFKNCSFIFEFTPFSSALEDGIFNDFVVTYQNSKKYIKNGIFSKDSLSKMYEVTRKSIFAYYEHRNNFRTRDNFESIFHIFEKCNKKNVEKKFEISSNGDDYYKQFKACIKEFGKLKKTLQENKSNKTNYFDLSLQSKVREFSYDIEDFVNKPKNPSEIHTILISAMHYLWRYYLLKSDKIQSADTAFITIPLLAPSATVNTDECNQIKEYEGQGDAYLFLIQESKNNLKSLIKNKSHIIKFLSYILKDILMNRLLHSGLILRKKMLKSTIKSAISTIMSRNMSHNIGSHVLSSVGHESISAADDRMLNKYVQKRMDYIAQISTEIPNWTASSWFVSDIMKRFYMQKHLLNYIGRSEGLKAYYWEEKDGIDHQDNAIQIKIIDKYGNYIIGAKKSNSDFYDIQVDIPGGVIGYHAFYAILENVIRNAAKHDWSKQKKGNLEITIEMKEPKGKDYFIFEIYNNSTIINKESSQEDSFQLDEIISDKMEKGFLDNEGKLIKSDWGLGEIRISAGYLNKKSHIEIGGEDGNKLIDSDAEKGFIQPFAKELDNDEVRLGYKIKLLKPKDLLIVGKIDDINFEEKQKQLQKHAIYYVSKLTEQNFKDGLNFKFVLFTKDGYDNFKQDFYDNNHNYIEKLPCRILVLADEKDIDENLKSRLTAIPENIDYKYGNDKIRGLLTFTNENSFDDLKVALFAYWVKTLANKKVGQDVYLYVDTKGEPQKDIEDKVIDYISDHREQFYDKVLKNVIDDKCENNRVKTALEEKLKKIKKSKEKIKKIVSISHKERPRRQEDKLKEILPEEFCNYLDLIKKSNEYFQFIKVILEDLLFKYEENIETLPYVLEAKNNTEGISKDISDIVETGYLKNKLINNFNNKDCLASYIRHISTDKINNYLSNKNFYIESLSGSQFYYNILEENYYRNDYTGQVFRRELIENALLNYTIVDERIAGYVHKNNQTIKMKALRIDTPYAFIYDDKVTDVIQSPYCVIDKEGKINNRYRNDEFINRINIYDKENIKDMLDADWLGFLPKDNDQPQLLPEKYELNDESYRIQITKDEDKYKLNFYNKDTIFNLKNLSKDLDVFIIHQGILDKIDITKSEIETLINKVKESVPHVFVTSGRGKPDTIPNNCKFIAFSSIESALAKDYPDKYLLTNLIMKVFHVEDKNAKN